MRWFIRPAAAIAAVALVGGLTACGSSGGSPSKTSGSSTGANSKAIATFAKVTGKATTVVLDPTFKSELAALKVTEKAQGKATLDTASGTYTFPITGGNATFYDKGAADPAVQGTFDHSGSGLTLNAESYVVSLQNLVVTTGKDAGFSGTVLVNGKPLGGTLKLFDLDTSSAAPTMSGGVATVSGLPVYVASTAALALNAVLKLSGSTALPTTAHAIKVGTATITATGS